MAFLSRAKGFCDLNIPITHERGDSLKDVVLTALSMGYQTIALNHEVDSMFLEQGFKKKKTANKIELVPSPTTVELTEQDLQKYGITRKPVLLTRLTIKHSDKWSLFVAQHAEAIAQYDMFALVVEDDIALKQCVENRNANVDIISLSLEQSSCRLSRSLLRSAIERDIYFELCYSLCLKSKHERSAIIRIAHYLYSANKAANIIMTSGAKSAKHLRRPYDVLNVGRFLGMSEFASKSAISVMSHNAVYCALAKRNGISKCTVQCTILDEDMETSKYEGLGDAREYLKTVDDSASNKDKERELFSENERKRKIKKKSGSEVKKKKLNNAKVGKNKKAKLCS